MNNPNNTAVTISGSGKITAVINGQVYTLDQSHPNYTKALDSVKLQDWESFLDHVDITRKVQDFILNNDVKIVDGIITYKDEIIHNTLTKRVISFMQQDLPFKPLLNFLYNLMENPSYRAVNELYDFLDAGELPITEDGHFLAFKNVRADYKDIHSGTFDNSVGSICEMPRYKVDEDKDRTCSTGLHFCSINYLPHFSDSNGGHTMIVKINPKDVVSIPTDYNNTKGRCSRYEVIGEYTEDWRSKLGRGENGFSHDLYSSDGGEYEEETCENCGTTLDNYDEDETLCNSCANSDECDENHCFCDKQDEHGDIACKQDEDQYPKTTRNYDPVKEPEIEEMMQKLLHSVTDEAQVGNEGDDHLSGGQATETSVGVKPDGTLFHNLRDRLGRFVKNNVG